MKKLNLSITFVIIAAVFLLTGCQSGQIQTVSSPQVLAEFEIKGDMEDILLPVEFEGREYQFLLDTGTTNTLFDQTFKDKLGKRIFWPRKGDAAYGKKVTVEMFHAPNAWLGPFNLKNMRYVVAADLNKIIPGESRNFQGIVGMDFMQSYIVQMDFDKRKISFLKGTKEPDLFGFYKPKENEYPEWGEPVPLKRKWFSNLRYVKGRLMDKINAEFLIDSGWHFPGVLKSSLFDRVSSMISQMKDGTQSAAVRTNNRGKVIITEEFSVGPFEYSDMFFQKSNLSILGLPFLSRHLVTFDFPNDTMYLEKGMNFNKPSIPPIYIEGLEFAVQYVGTRAIVTFVDPNGPAYVRGVRKNDILIKINDIDITSFSVTEFTEFWTNLFSRPVSVLSFTFRRDNDIITIAFVSRDKNIKSE
jgi:hypothetical protein